MRPQKNVENTSIILTFIFISVFISVSVYLMYIGLKEISNNPMISIRYLSIGVFIFLFILVLLIKSIFKKTIPKKLITLYLADIKGNGCIFINDKGKIIGFNNNNYIKGSYYLARANNYEIEQIIEPTNEVFDIKESYFGRFYLPFTGSVIYGNLGMAMIYLLLIYSIVSINLITILPALTLLIYDFAFKKRKNAGLSTDSLDASALKAFNLFAILKYSIVAFIFIVFSIAIPQPFNYFIIPFFFILLSNIIVLILENRIDRKYSSILRKYLFFINNEGPIIIFLILTILSIIFKSFYGILFTFPFWIFIIKHIYNWIASSKTNYLSHIVNKSLMLLHEKDIITCDYNKGFRFINNDLIERFPILVKKHSAYFEVDYSENEIWVKIFFVFDDNIKEEYKENVHKYLQEKGYNIPHNKNNIIQKLNKSILCKNLVHKKDMDKEYITNELILILQPFISEIDASKKEEIINKE